MGRHACPQRNVPGYHSIYISYGPLDVHSGGVHVSGLDERGEGGAGGDGADRPGGTGQREDSRLWRPSFLIELGMSIPPTAVRDLRPGDITQVRIRQAAFMSRLGSDEEAAIQRWGPAWSCSGNSWKTTYVRASNAQALV